MSPPSIIISFSFLDCKLEKKNTMSLISNLGYLSWVSILLALFNLGLILIGGLLVVAASPDCLNRQMRPLGVVTLIALVRILYMIGAAKAQQATAATIVAETIDCVVDTDRMIRKERRMRYRRWLWWTRFGTVVATLHFLVALYVMYILAKDISSSDNPNMCFLGQSAEERGWKESLMISFLILLWVVVIIQCVSGSEVLKWRSFYLTHDGAWKAHYREMFDHSIREALCCMGRAKYLSDMEDDEVYSVARLLGDLVVYRASGTGHLELLAGIALLQKQKNSPRLYAELTEAPEAYIQEAALFQLFSEAAYTGPLLDIGRNPVLFPCAWIHRQGFLTPWSRSRRPVLEGDNWWRGHAAAFLKCISLPPEALRKGRVIQRKREAAYFIVVLHELKSVVVAVRGTETPEDLLTDGLCKECNLSLDDLDGLVNSDQLSQGVRETVLSTFPHYGHSGIVESARELCMQIDGHPGGEGFPYDSPSGKHGFLSSLLGDGCECHGYKIIIVGHSLGGAVATLLGVRLYARYPNLRVYAYGPLPSMDSVIAEACSSFVTSIVYNDEFSSRLSINSILRLRESAIAALADDSSADSALTSKLIRRILQSRKSDENNENDMGEDGHHVCRRKPVQHTIKGGVFLCGHAASCIVQTHKRCASSRVMDAIVPEPEFVTENVNVHNNLNIDMISFEGHGSAFVDDATSTVEVSTVGSKEAAEVFLAGFIIHIVPQQRKGYKAFLGNRECFKDIVVSPYMFLDHLPWRCHHALRRVLETRKLQEQLNADLLDGEIQV